MAFSHQFNQDSTREPWHKMNRQIHKTRQMQRSATDPAKYHFGV